MDAASDPYLPYDGGGDCIPLRELHKRGNAGCWAGPGRGEAVEVLVGGSLRAQRGRRHCAHGSCGGARAAVLLLLG